jgi:uncharacterized protein YjiS (DUF1127 family)
MDTISRSTLVASAPRRGGTYTRRLGTLIVSVLAGFERARQRRALMALDDRLLKDIGISRGEALCEWRKAPWKG